MTRDRELPKGIRLDKGRFLARIYRDGRTYSKTWDTEQQASAWLQRTRRELADGTHQDMAVTDPTTGKALAPLVGEYAALWVAERDLKPRTRSEYRRLLPHLEPLARYRLDQVTRDMVKAWHKALDVPQTHKAHIYGMVRAIFNTAVRDEHIDVSPVVIDGAGKVRKRPMPTLPTAVEVHQLADAMPSDKYRVLTLVAAWCGLRFGEVTELRRKDVVIRDGVPIRLRVHRAVTHVDGEAVIGTPKSSAGVRDVGIPPHIRGDVSAYLDALPNRPGRLLFPGSRSGAHLRTSSLYRVWYAARDEVGFPSLRWHDLRHFAGTTAAQSGATLAELQARLGHSTVRAAMTYQHAVSGRDDVIAEAMSNVVELKPRTA